MGFDLKSLGLFPYTIYAILEQTIGPIPHPLQSFPLVKTDRMSYCVTYEASPEELE